MKKLLSRITIISAFTLAIAGTVYGQYINTEDLNISSYQYENEVYRNNYGCCSNSSKNRMDYGMRYNRINNNIMSDTIPYQYENNNGFYKNLYGCRQNNPTCENRVNCIYNNAI